MFLAFDALLGAHGLKVTRSPSPYLLERRDDDNRTIPILITNNCPETMWPGIWTQYGGGPLENGHELGPGEQAEHLVSSDWQGRVWARTNCSFGDDGRVGPDATFGGNRACGTGDCNGLLNCEITVSTLRNRENPLRLINSQGLTPVTLAEFNMDGGDGLTYYDISLVDGYNVPIAIVLLPLGNSSLIDIPPNLTNPSCQGTSGLLAPADQNPYNGRDGQYYLGTNSTYPLPFDTAVTDYQVSKWCPWNLQQTPPEKPGDGVYPYPDDDIQRPGFNPCYSACAKWNKAADCCTGDHDSASTCSPSEYSRAAKRICPDAYSYGEFLAITGDTNRGRLRGN